MHLLRVALRISTKTIITYRQTDGTSHRSVFATSGNTRLPNDSSSAGYCIREVCKSERPGVEKNIVNYL